MIAYTGATTTINDNKAVSEMVQPKVIEKEVVEEIKETVSENTEKKTSITSKTEVNRMNKETLIKVGKEIGIYKPEEVSGRILKEEIIKYFKL